MRNDISSESPFGAMPKRKSAPNHGFWSLPFAFWASTAAEVKTAMEPVSPKDVKDWGRQNIGESFLSKRKTAFSLKKTNQKILR